MGNQGGAGLMRPAPILPNGWPAGRTLAVSVSVMLEGWTDNAAPGVVMRATEEGALRYCALVDLMRHAVDLA